MENLPLISIILPVYNGEKHLKEAIESCIAQSYKNWELVIINDASTDNSLKIVENFQQLDSRIKFFNNDINLSLPGSLNKGHKIASGELITWTSHDNILKGEFLETLYYNLKSKNCDIIFSNYDIIWSDGTFKREQISGPVQALILRNSVGASFLYKSEVFNMLGGYAEDLFLVEDYHFFLMASLKFNMYHLDKNLYQYRIHKDSLSGSIQNKEEYRIQHTIGITNMFQAFGAQINLNETTIAFLSDLYLKIPMSVKDFAFKRKLIEKDIYIYQKKIKIAKGTLSPLKLVYQKLTKNWIQKVSDQNRKELLKLIIFNPVILIKRLEVKQIIRIFRILIFN